MVENLFKVFEGTLEINMKLLNMFESKLQLQISEYNKLKNQILSVVKNLQRKSIKRVDVKRTK